VLSLFIPSDRPHSASKERVSRPGADLGLGVRVGGINEGLAAEVAVLPLATAGKITRPTARPADLIP